MNQFYGEIAIVIALIFLNGFFSGAEMALVSMRKTRVRELAKNGNKKAKLISDILENPENFLAVIQIGITLIGTIASAFAGAKIAEAIAPIFLNSNISFLVSNAETISLVLIIIAITYLTLIFGELIPKSLGIKYSERFALWAVRFIYVLSKVFYPIIKLLTVSSNLVLRFFGDKTNFSESHFTEEEIRAILHDSHKAGTIEKGEHELLDNVFNFADISVGQIMTPRSKIFALDIESSTEENIKELIECGYTRVPFYKGTIENIIGILNTKSLLQALGGKKEDFSIEKYLKKALFIPKTIHISDLLLKMQKEKIHMVIVTDEYGEIDGLITIEDILEEIVGDINDESDEDKPLIVPSTLDTFEVDASISIVDFNKYFESNFSEEEGYGSISGLLLNHFEKIPKEGERVSIDNIEFVIKSSNERTIKSVIVKKLIKKELG